MRKKVWGGLLVMVMVTGCATNHFDTVVPVAAGEHRAGNMGSMHVTRLSSYAFRVDVGDRASFYRCYYKRKTMGQTQCCYPVENESSATAIFGVESSEATCMSFLDL